MHNNTPHEIFFSPLSANFYSSRSTGPLELFTRPGVAGAALQTPH